MMRALDGPLVPDGAGTTTPVADRRWVQTFDDRYGEGSFDRLLVLLLRPCVTFADIATRFGVTRENVRQWHRRLLPGAPRGHERQRLCRALQERRRLLTDRLFGGFYRHMRSQLPAQRVGLVSVGGGFSRRQVRLDGRLVALRRARRHSSSEARAGSYQLTNGVGSAEFVYYELTSTDFLFVPRHLVAARATFRDTGESSYEPFRNTFAALATTVRVEQRRL